jgi:muramoyltetrapeptide carboxypeptidase
MITPPKLVKNSRIAIVSPSGATTADFIETASNYIKAKGFEPIVYPSCLNRHFQFGGTDQERLFDLQSALDDVEIDAILCSRGGYGLIRLVDKLDFTEFLKKPKWVAGFSDITNLHLAINKIGVKSIHSQMTKAIHEFPGTEAVENIFDIFEGEIPKITVDTHEFNRNGFAEAEIVGGNLSIIYSMQATKFEINTQNKILVIEDLNEYLYHLDRIMINMKMSGKLSNLAGLIVGAFTDMKDNPNPFGKTPYEIVSEHVAEYDYPVSFDFPIGHIDNNRPFISGHKYSFSVNKNVELY